MTWLTELEGLFIVAQPFDRFRLLPRLSNNSFVSYSLIDRFLSIVDFRFSKIVGGYAITYPPAKIKKLSKGERELASKDPNVTYKVPIAIVF